MARKSVTVPVNRLPSESERDAQTEQRRRLRRRGKIQVEIAQGQED